MNSQGDGRPVAQVSLLPIPVLLMVFNQVVSCSNILRLRFHLKREIRVCSESCKANRRGLAEKGKAIVDQSSRSVVSTNRGADNIDAAVVPDCRLF